MRFIILGTARVGSNLLVDLLRSQPGVTVFGELFNLTALDRATQVRVLRDPVEYLESQLYSRDNINAEAAGFKIFYYHATKEHLLPGHYPDSNLIYAPKRLRNRITRFHDLVREHFNLDDIGARLEQVWQHLRNDHALKVIHLKRRNKLATFHSLRRAFVTDQWVRHSEMTERTVGSAWGILSRLLKTDEPECTRQASVAIHLSYEDCLEAFQRTADWERQYDEFFAGHAKMDLWYEELSNAPDTVMARIQTFLNLPSQVSRTTLQRQNRQPLSDVIENYEELKRQFATSPWREYFED